jgi:succinate dehydrogenase / fumarate reductase flavoprotein subunit
MQGLADGYFVLPSTIPNYLAENRPTRIDTSHPAFQEAKQAVSERVKRLLSIQGERSVESIYRELGTMMWNQAGMARTDRSLREALACIPQLREEFWTNVRVLGQNEEINQSLERAGRVADFLELAELLCIDALHRTESCGAHFREESQTEEGEALRDDENFSYVAAWQYGGEGGQPVLRKEPLDFENVHLAVRSYK